MRAELLRVTVGSAPVVYPDRRHCSSTTTAGALRPTPVAWMIACVELAGKSGPRFRTTGMSHPGLYFYSSSLLGEKGDRVVFSWPLLPYARRESSEASFARRSRMARFTPFTEAMEMRSEKRDHCESRDFLLVFSVPRGGRKGRGGCAYVLLAYWEYWERVLGEKGEGCTYFYSSTWSGPHIPEGGCRGCRV